MIEFELRVKTKKMKIESCEKRNLESKSRYSFRKWNGTEMNSKRTERNWKNYELKFCWKCFFNIIKTSLFSLKGIELRPPYSDAKRRVLGNEEKNNNELFFFFFLKSLKIGD